MLYVLFFVLTIFYNFIKFKKERLRFLSSLIEATSSHHREMILGYYFYIFIFEGFLAFVVAHLLTKKAAEIGVVGLGVVYLLLIFIGFYLYSFFIKYLERKTKLNLYESFKNHITKELRLNFALILLPVLIYSAINFAMSSDINENFENLEILEFLVNTIFVSVLTILCTAIIILRLIPNRDITEPEYLEIIQKRLLQINQPKMRLRWIEMDIKNAFVLGLKLVLFSNHTLFIGRSLRTMLSFEEFDAVVAHELSHVAQGHVQKRLINLIKNFIITIFGSVALIIFIFCFAVLILDEDTFLHGTSITLICSFFCLLWLFFNFSTLFETFRSQEFEADGYAVIELGADFTAFKSAIQKLSIVDNLPRYLIEKTQKKTSNLSRRLIALFSTHPEIDQRVSLLEYKIYHRLPFNYHLSTSKKLKNIMSSFLSWKVFAPILTFSFFIGLWVVSTIRDGAEMVKFISSSDTESILNRRDLTPAINSKPFLLGQTLMYFVVIKKDKKIIDHFIDLGADKGKTLLYMSQLKDYELFYHYYKNFENDISASDYYLLLRKSAQLDFFRAYKLLANSKKFEKLDHIYKKEIALIHRQRQRSPASY